MAHVIERWRASSERWYIAYLLIGAATGVVNIFLPLLVDRTGDASQVGIVVAAVVSPYRATRDEVRGMLPEGTFLEVFVDTPIEICEARDVKGWYAKARSGEVTGLTGIDDPYEPPISPELRLETVGTTVDANAQRVLELLVRRGDLAPG